MFTVIIRNTSVSVCLRLFLFNGSGKQFWLDTEIEASIQCAIDDVILREFSLAD